MGGVQLSVKCVCVIVGGVQGAFSLSPAPTHIRSYVFLLKVANRETSRQRDKQTTTITYAAWRR